MVLESIRPARPVRGRARHLFEPVPDGVRHTVVHGMEPIGFEAVWRRD